jgi:hypothetical protein
MRQKWLIFRDPSGRYRTTRDVMNGLLRRRLRTRDGQFRV